MRAACDDGSQGIALLLVGIYVVLVFVEYYMADRYFSMPLDLLAGLLTITALVLYVIANMSGSLLQAER